MAPRSRRRTRTLTRDQTLGKPVRRKRPRKTIRIDWRRILFKSLIGLILTVNLVLVFFIVRRWTGPRIPDAPRTRQEQPERVLQIEVLNGCGVNRLASRFTDYLRQADFDVIRTDDYETYNVEKTVVIDRRGNLQSVFRIADALGLDRIRVLQEVNPAYLIDATVILGRDFRSLGAWNRMEN